MQQPAEIVARRPTSVQFYQRLHARNDTNGQPRRLCLVYASDGRIIATIDEAQTGQLTWFRNYGAVELPSLPISASTYRRFKRAAARTT